MQNMWQRILVAVTMTAALALGADVSGKWVASVQGRDGQAREVTYNFKSDGDTLTGTVAGPRGDMEISDGKIDGDKISFKTKVEFNGNAMVMVYQGVVNGDEIKFTQTREGGDRSREFTAKRAK
jgi:hypothetical protein